MHLQLGLHVRIARFQISTTGFQAVTLPSDRKFLICTARNTHHKTACSGESLHSLQLQPARVPGETSPRLLWMCALSDPTGLPLIQLQSRSQLRLRSRQHLGVHSIAAAVLQRHACGSLHCQAVNRCMRATPQQCFAACMVTAAPLPRGAVPLLPPPGSPPRCAPHSSHTCRQPPARLRVIAASIRTAQPVTLPHSHAAPCGALARLTCPHGPPCLYSTRAPCAQATFHNKHLSLRGDSTPPSRPARHIRTIPRPLPLTQTRGHMHTRPACSERMWPCRLRRAASLGQQQLHAWVHT